MFLPLSGIAQPAGLDLYPGVIEASLLEAKDFAVDGLPLRSRYPEGAKIAYSGRLPGSQRRPDTAFSLAGKQRLSLGENSSWHGSHKPAPTQRRPWFLSRLPVRLGSLVGQTRGCQVWKRRPFGKLRTGLRSARIPVRTPHCRPMMVGRVSIPGLAPHGGRVRLDSGLVFEGRGIGKALSQYVSLGSEIHRRFWDTLRESSTLTNPAMRGYSYLQVSVRLWGSRWRV